MRRSILPITLSDDVELDPTALADTRAIIQASSGGGKSVLLRRIVEEAANHMPVIIIDSEGEFSTIREVCSMVLIGPGGEIGADPNTAGRVARGLLKESCSAIVDISELPRSLHDKFIAAFFNSIMHAPTKLWRPTLFGIDEAHRFCPEGGKHSYARDAILELMTRGRKRHYGGILCTQRISALHKSAVAEGANKFFGRTTLDNDIKRSAQMLGMTTSEAIVLRDLEPHEWFAFGPAINHTGVVRFTTNMPQTRPPKSGSGHSPPVKSSGVVSKIAKSLARSIEKSDEPLTLDEAKDQIESLQKQLGVAKQSTALDTGDTIKRSYDKGYLKGSNDALETFDPAISQLKHRVNELHDSTEKHVKEIRDVLTLLDDSSTRAKLQPPTSIKEWFGKTQETEIISANGETKSTTHKRKPDKEGFVPTVVHVEPTRGRQNTRERILYALKWWKQVGVAQPSIKQIGYIAERSATSGTFTVNKSSLQKEGLIEYCGNSTVSLTPAGEKIAPHVAHAGTLEHYHQMIYAKLGRGAKAKILEAVLRNGTRHKSFEDIAAQCNLSPTSGTTTSSLGTLRKLGLIEAGQPIRPTSLLYPAELVEKAAQA